MSRREEGKRQERRRGGKMNGKGQLPDGIRKWSERETSREEERKGNNRKNGRSGYKGETVSQFANPDFRSRASIHVFTLTAPISFLSISLLSDTEKTVLPDAFHSDRFCLWWSSDSCSRVSLFLVFFHHFLFDLAIDNANIANYFKVTILLIVYRILTQERLHKNISKR